MKIFYLKVNFVICVGNVNWLLLMYEVDFSFFLGDLFLETILNYDKISKSNYNFETAFVIQLYKTPPPHPPPHLSFSLLPGVCTSPTFMADEIHCCFLFIRFLFNLSSSEQKFVADLAYNVQESQLRNIYMSVWVLCATLLMQRPHGYTLRDFCRDVEWLKDLAINLGAKVAWPGKLLNTLPNFKAENFCTLNSILCNFTTFF